MGTLLTIASAKGGAVYWTVPQGSHGESGYLLGIRFADGVRVVMSGLDVQKVVSEHGFVHFYLMQSVSVRTGKRLAEPVALDPFRTMQDLTDFVADNIGDEYVKLLALQKGKGATGSAGATPVNRKPMQ
jgi:hypothetical protein